MNHHFVPALACRRITLHWSTLNSSLALNGIVQIHCTICHFASQRSLHAGGPLTIYMSEPAACALRWGVIPQADASPWIQTAPVLPPRQWEAVQLYFKSKSPFIRKKNREGRWFLARYQEASRLKGVELIALPAPRDWRTSHRAAKRTVPRGSCGRAQAKLAGEPPAWWPARSHPPETTASPCAAPSREPRSALQQSITHATPGRLLSP